MYSDIIRNYQIPLANGTIERLQEIFDAKKPNSELIQKAIYEYLDAVEVLTGKKEADVLEENRVLAYLIQEYPVIKARLMK